MANELHRMLRAELQAALLREARQRAARKASERERDEYLDALHRLRSELLANRIAFACTRESEVAR